MNTIEGTAKRIRFSTEFEGTDSQTTTSHVAVFELDGKPVELKLSENIILREGDQVLIAGTTKRGLFRGMAYFNKTVGVKGKEKTAALWIGGIIFCMTLLLLPFGIWALMRAIKLQIAFTAVDK